METSFVMVGHADVGKSFFCGHLLYLCGHIDEHQKAEVEKDAIKDKMEKWRWARLLDIYPEERRRCKTHDFMDLKIYISRT